MAISLRFRNLDLFVMLVLTCAPLALFEVFGDYPGKRELPLPQAQLHCLKGSCFLLPQESKILIKLPPLRTVIGFFQDKVITLGTESELEIVFPDKSKLIQRNTSLLQIQKGRGSLLRELERGSAVSDPEKKEKKEQAAQSIIYVGNLPLEILYPIIDSEIIPESYPSKLRVTVRIANKLSTNEVKDMNFNEWSLYRMQDKQAPLHVLDFNFIQSQIPEHYSSELMIPTPGSYLLTPKGLDPNISFNGFKLSFSERRDLDSRIQDLLDNYDSKTAKPLELRQE